MIQQALLSFFEHVAQKDPILLDKIEQQECFKLEQARWSFTLPDLYQFLAHQNDVFGQIDYRQFRQLIFKSPINSNIKTHGAEIQIAENSTKVDRTRYALVWPDTNTPTY